MCSFKLSSSVGFSSMFVFKCFSPSQSHVQLVTMESEPLPMSLVVAGREGWCSLIEVDRYISTWNEKTKLASTAGVFQENVVFRA